MYPARVPNINVPVDQVVYDAAKVAAAKAGMLFRKWVERAIADAADLPNSPVAVDSAPVKLREPRYEPVD